MNLGIEIGGTKLQLGVGDGERADFQAFERHRIVAADGAQGILRQIHASAQRLLSQCDVTRVGIGFGGPVEAAAGRVITSHQIDGWTAFPLVDWVKENLNLPAVLGNDCDCAALAEARYGAARGRQTVFYVTVGTGVGGGLVISGRVHGTNRPAVAEIGHLRPGLLAVSSDDTVESIVSGPGIAATARACLLGLPERTQDRLLPQGRPEMSDVDRRDLLERSEGAAEAMTAQIIAEAAAAGNEAARAIIQTATDTLGWAIAQMSSLLAPDVVVIGGGVSLMGDELFLEPVRQAARRYAFAPLRDACEFVSPQLGEDVVVHGAIALGNDV